GAADQPKHTGTMTEIIEDVLNLAPAREDENRGGDHRYVFEGNWKAQADNLKDLYHPPYSHESTTKEGRQFQRQASRTGAQLMDEDGNPISFWDETGVRAYANGHGYCGKLPDVTRGVGPGGD